MRQQYLVYFDCPTLLLCETPAGVDQVVKGDEVFGLSRLEQVYELASPFQGLSERVIPAVSRSTGPSGTRAGVGTTP